MPGRLLALLLAILFQVPVIVALAQVTAGPDSPTRPDDEEYEVATRWMSYVVAADGGVAEVLGYFETYQEAVTRSTEWSKSHPQSLAPTNEIEVQVRIRKEKPTASQRTPRREPELIQGSALPFVDAKPIEIPAGEKNADSVAGKSGEFIVGGSKALIHFGKDGTLVFSDASNPGKEINSGTWSQTGAAVSMVTAKYRYMGVVKGNTLQGNRVNRDLPNQRVEQWKVILNVVGQPARPDTKTSPGLRLENTTWTAVVRQGFSSTVEWVYTFRANQEFVGRADWDARDNEGRMFVGGDDISGRWTQNGVDVTVTSPSGFPVWSGRIENGRIRVIEGFRIKTVEFPGGYLLNPR